MPRLRTDDGPRKLRAVWLGPAGHTLPFQWTYVQWAVTLIAVPVAGTIGTAIVWFLLHDMVWALGIGGLWCGAGGVYLAVRLMKNVTFDEPLSYQRRLVKTEFSRGFSQPVGARRISVEFTTPPITYLAPAIRRSMGWDLEDQQPLPVSVAPSPDAPRSSAPMSPVAAPESSTSPSPQTESARPRNPYLTSHSERP